MDDQPRGIQSRIKFFNELGWTCKKCGENSPFDEKFCKKCHRRNVAHDRLQMSIRKTAQAGIWHCTTCTFVNEERFPNCEICSTPRYEEKPSASSDEKVVKSDKNNNDSNPPDSIEGKSGLLQSHDWETKVHGEEQVRNVNKFFDIRNNPLFKFIFGTKLAKKDKDKIDTDTLLLNDSSEDEKDVDGKQHKVDGLSLTPGPWSCEKCSCCNQESRQTCIICGKSRPVIKGILKKEKSLRIEDLLKQEEREAHEKWLKIIAKCQKKRVRFVDDSFAPGRSSLYLEPLEESSNPKWLRCNDIISKGDKKIKEWVVYRHEPEPEDIEQGFLGNCWLLCALAVLAKRKDLLEKIILTKTFCDEGAYHVRLCKDGFWTIVLVDDFFPCYSDKTLLYSKGKRKQLWVPLIEKAAAKIHGCYESLTAGICVEALSLLTGEPCKVIYLQEQKDDDSEIKEEKIWKEMLQANRSNFLMAASCVPDENLDEFYKNKGLCPQHAYSVLDVKDVDGNKLVRLRNPWGTGSWNGRWSDKSPIWSTVSDSAKQNLELNKNEKGIFWMWLRDFIAFFYSVEVCKVRADWHELRIRGAFPYLADQPWKLFKLYINDKTELDLNLFQKTERGTCYSEDCWTSVDIMIVILESPEGQDESIVRRVVANSRRTARSFVGIEVTLDPGCYTVVCLAFKYWQTGFPLLSSAYADFFEYMNKDFALSVHSSRLVTYSSFYTDGPGDYFLADTVIQLAIQRGQKSVMDPNGLVVYVLWWYGAIFVVENGIFNKHVSVKCNCSKCSYLISTRGTFETMDNIPPRQRQVIMVLTPLDPKRGWCVCRDISYLIGNESGLHEHWNVPVGVQHVPGIESGTAGLHSPRPMK